MENEDISKTQPTRRDLFLAGVTDGLTLAGCMTVMTIIGVVLLTLAWELFLEAWWQPRVSGESREPIQEIVFGMILGIIAYLFGSLWSLRRGSTVAQTLGQAARNLGLVRADGAPATPSQRVRWWSIRHALLFVLLMELCVHLYFCFKVHRLSRGELDDVDHASRLFAAGSAAICAIVVIADLYARRAGAPLAEWGSGLRVAVVNPPQSEFDDFGKVRSAPLKFHIAATMVDAFFEIGIPFGFGWLFILLSRDTYRYWSGMVLLFAVYVMPILYCLPEAVRGRTLGHSLLALRIVEMRGVRADALRRMLRFGFRRILELALATTAVAIVGFASSRRFVGGDWYVYAGVAGWIAAIGFFITTGIVLLCPGRRGLHDRISGTTLCREQDLPGDANVFRGFQPVMTEAMTEIPTSAARLEETTAD